MRYAKIEKNSVANGPGIRVVLWCQGCSIHCQGCHNESTWDFDGGYIFNQAAVQQIVDELKYEHVDGITLSGGHPLEESNILECIALCQYIRSRFPEKTIWLYTGLTLTLDQFLYKIRGIAPEHRKHNNINQLLNLCDVVVDGPYIESQRDLMQKYCGSSNQRVIDVKKTIQNKQITLYEE